ncbi:MAG: tyrosine-type recombinase/integrase [Draconibacterium sp.]
MKKTQSKLILVKQGQYKYIYLYYKFKNKLIRINTGNKFVNNCMTKDFLYNSKMENQKELNYKTTNLKSKVDDYISYRLNNGWRQITKEECLSYIESGFDSVSTFLKQNGRKNDIDIDKNKPLSVSDYLQRFYVFKKDELNNRLSYKDYLTFINSLEDFQKYFKIELTFEYLNTEEFLVKYRNFLSIDRGTDYKKNGYKTKGGLNDNTINKRFSSLETFFLWIENRDVYTFKKSIHSFSVPKYENENIELTNDEIQQLYDLKITNKTWSEIRDVFICNCFMGFRISDLKTLKKSNFTMNDKGYYVVKKENQKTNFKVEIPIVETPLTILQKYDFQLPKFSDQHFNRVLKNILENYDLFPEVVVKKRRSNRVNQDKEYMKRELISSHTCRKTFINLLITNNIPINIVMNSSGHKKIETIEKHYMKKTQDYDLFKTIDLKPKITESNT